MKKVVYTAITNNYDMLKCPKIIDKDIDYIAYTDNSKLKTKGPWQIRPITVSFRNPRVNARWYKILPHRHLGGYDQSLWVDASFQLHGSVSLFMDRLNKLASFVAVRHPKRDCLYEEAEEVKKVKKDDPQIVDRQINHYKNLNYPYTNGLCETGILFRNHKETAIELAMEDWWHQIKCFSQRDQLSLNYILWKHHLFCYQLEKNIFDALGCLKKHNFEDHYLPNEVNPSQSCGMTRPLTIVKNFLRRKFS